MDFFKKQDVKLVRVTSLFEGKWAIFLYRKLFFELHTFYHFRAGAWWGPKPL